MANARFKRETVFKAAIAAAKIASKNIAEIEKKQKEKHEEALNFIMLPKWWRPWRISREMAEYKLNKQLLWGDSGISNVYKDEREKSLLRDGCLKAKTIAHLAAEADEDYVLLSEEDATCIFKFDAVSKSLGEA